MVMPAVDRELAISYGALSVGGTTDRLIDGYVRITKSFVTASVEFDFVISSSTEAAFATEIALVEASFRIPFKNLLVEQGSNTLLSLSHSANSGLNTMPTILKMEDLKDTGRSRRYTVRIDCEMPADNAPTSGVRESSVNVAYSPARKREVTISGVGTAISADDARTKYEAIIDAFCGSILTTLGGTYELGEEPNTETDYETKTIRFTRVYDEIIYSQAGSSDDSRIVRQSIVISRSQIGPGDTINSNAERLVNLSCVYSAWIDKDITQDLAGVWSAIKGWVYSTIQNTFESGAIAITETAPNYDYDENQLTIQIAAVGSTGSKIIEHKQTVQLTTVEGVVLIPAWTGNPMSKYRYQGPQTVRRTTTTTQRKLMSVTGGGFSGGGGGGSVNVGIGGSSGAFAFNLAPGGVTFGGRGGDNAERKAKQDDAGPAFAVEKGDDAPSGSVWVGISYDVSKTPLRVGTDNYTFDVLDVSSVLIEEAYAPIAIGSPAVETSSA